MSNWQIGESGTAFPLDDLGRGEVTLTVTNTGPTQDRAVLTVTALDGAAESWFTIEEPQKAVPPGQSVTYLCKALLPPETAAGVYACQFIAYSADQDPGENSATSRRITVEKKLPAKPPPGTPWWIFAVAAAVLLVVVGVIAWIVLKDDGGDLANEQAPTITGEPQVLQPLAATPGEWSESGLAFTFAWQRCDAEGKNCSAIDSATLPAYAIGNDDVGKTLRVEVTATKGEDASAKAVSVPTGLVIDVGGAPVEVPPVVDLTVSQATALLAENFQVIRLTAGDPVNSCNPLVTDQSPDGGATLERGEAVAISAPPSSPLIRCRRADIDLQYPYITADGVERFSEQDVSVMTDGITGG
jgi:hypothetical protein